MAHTRAHLARIALSAARVGHHGDSDRQVYLFTAAQMHAVWAALDALEAAEHAHRLLSQSTPAGEVKR